MAVSPAAGVAVNAGVGVNVPGGALVVALEVRFHPAVDTEVVLLQVPRAAVVVVVAAAVCGVVGNLDRRKRARFARLGLLHTNDVMRHTRITQGKHQHYQGRLVVVLR